MQRVVQNLSGFCVVPYRMTIPVALLTRDALTDVGHAIAMKKLPRQAGGVLWDYLTEQGLLTHLRLRKLPKRPVNLRAHQWIVWDAVLSARALKPGHPIAKEALQVTENWLREPTKQNMEACHEVSMSSWDAPSHNVIHTAVSACMAVHSGMNSPAHYHAIMAAAEQESEQQNMYNINRSRYNATPLSAVHCPVCLSTTCAP